MLLNEENYKWKSMAKVKYIMCDPYKRGIHVFIGSLEELKKWVVKEYDAPNEENFRNFVLETKSMSKAMAQFFYCYRNGIGIVLISKFPKTPEEIASVSHELLHATFLILNYCFVDYNEESCGNEAFTYLHEHLLRNALEKEGYDDIE